MATVHKKKVEKPEVVADVITETTETIEIIEEAVPQATKSETPAKSSSSTDPLTEFKEKMIKEEHLNSDMPPKKNYMWPILFVFVIAIALLIGIFVYKQGLLGGAKTNVAISSPTPTATPAPTATLDLTKFEIEIQNGSGISGEAGRQRDNLTAEGFTISSIGNADNSDYTDTVIQAKKEVDKDFIEKLKSVLSDSFTVAEIEVLSDDSLVPVIVILGTKI